MSATYTVDVLEKELRDLSSRCGRLHEKIVSTPMSATDVEWFSEELAGAIRLLSLARMSIETRERFLKKGVDSV